ncbi:MAG: DUF1631 family protein, partial [Methylococcales bacterium]|nr:DUF1631 family protein [Methylococcales bacterium]
NSNSMLDLRAILLSEVQRMQSGGPEKQLAQTDSDTLDVLTMIFEFILEDKNLPDPMKVILGRLQIPLLKVSLMDKSFFGQKNHPARRLLNEMALAGLGWSADEGEGENTLYGVMTHIVQRVINEFDSQVSLFDDLLLDFKSFVEKEGKYAQVAEKRTNQVTKGKEQLELAKLQSLAEMETRLSDYLVPESIKALLEEGWKDVLVLLYLRQGVESEAYKAALQNLDQLLWSLQPVKETEERQKLLNMIPSITQKIQEGLIDISFESHKLSQLMKSIKEHHVDIIRGTVEIPVLDASQVIHPKKSRSSEVSDVEEIVMTDIQSTVEAQVEDDQYVAQARSLALGSWIEYLDESATAVRCKLSWKSEVTETFVFVNRAGSKVADMSLNGLTVLLRRESTQILQSVPLMDRAMSAMMSALKG